MAETRRYQVGVGCLVIGAVGILAYMALQIGALRALGADTVTVSALMPDVAGLSTGAAVSIAGVPVGRVEKLGVEQELARVELSLERSAGVRRDVQVAMRARSVLGEKYIELVPQSVDAPLAEDGDTLTNVRGSYEIDQLVTRLGATVEALDPDTLSDTLKILNEAMKEDPERAKRMLADLDHLLHNLSVASDELPGLVADTKGTLASLRRTADAARPALSRLDGTTRRLDELLAAVPPEDLPALLDDLRAAVKDGRATLVKVDGSVSELQTLLEKANSVTREDILRITQEEGVHVRLKPRSVEDLLEAEKDPDWPKKR